MKAKPISKALALELFERFRRHIPMGSEEECWNYAGVITTHGSGWMSAVAFDGKRYQLYAHRVVYVALRDEIPQGLDNNRVCTVTLSREELELVIGTLTERRREISAGNDFDQYGEAQAVGEVAERREAQAQQSPAQQYKQLLEATAALRYPPEERDAKLQARIEATISRKVAEFTQERQAKQYEASLRSQLAERHPNLTADQKREYDRCIARRVGERREAMARQKQQQQQGRGLEPSL